MASSSSSSSSYVPKPSSKKYDVFLSFRGEDTRNGFTSHLHTALKKKYIETYIDERLESGDVISEALLNAIEESKLSLIIFSENYASSSWCLEELVRILQCKEKNGQIVTPVFYHVDPSNVRKQQGSYAAAFATLEKRYKDDTDKLKQWRSALTTAANLSGWDGPITRNESELVETIVDAIENKLKSIPRNDDYCQGLIGIDKRIEHVESLLQMDSSLEKVRIIGIWGMGGLGKTTLAHVVFKQFYSRFEGTCFLENVREEWRTQGSVCLKNKFFSQLAEEKDAHTIVDIMSLKDKLGHKRLLIVLDDVDDLDYFECLVGDRNWLKPGSRIIITTRNKQVLRNIGVDELYDYEHLNENEALKLFCLNAFKESSLQERFKNLSRKVLNYAKGVPLALKVLGSHLYSRSEEEWESALKVIDLDQKIQNVLEISFNALKEKEKAIFLDIACFFKGMKRDYVEDILDNCGYSVYAITTLIDKALITIANGNTLWMHDLIQEIGWQIARGQSTGESLKPSRLWIADDIFHALGSNTGIETIEGIFLDANEIRKNINLNPPVFKRMNNLRLLKLSVRGGRCQLHFRRGLPFLPDNLTYLEWDRFPFRSLPSDFSPYNLVKLHMCSSQLQQLWNGLQDLERLKYVNLEDSKTLTNIPDLSQANLKILNLKGCISLVKVPPLRFQQATPREMLLARSFVFSSHDEYSSHTNYLLDLTGCFNLKTLSRMSGNIKHIRLASTAIQELHPSIYSLHSLVSIDLNNCVHFKSLPSNICELKSLEYINLEGCLSFNNLPVELPESLIELNLSATAIVQVHPSSFECLPNLKFLNMNNCTRLEALPASICQLKSLKRLSLSHCSKLKSFPEISAPMESLEVVFLKGIRVKELPWSLGAKSELLRSLLYARNPFSVRYCNICTGSCLHHNCYPAGIGTMPTILVDEIEVDLTCSRILKIPDWYNRSLSPSALVDQSSGTIDNIATVVFKVPKCGDPEFLICKCKNNGVRKGSFYLVKSTNEYPGRFMPITRHTEYLYPSFMQISCCECSNFDQVHKSVMNEVQNKIFRMATASTQEQIIMEISDKSGNYAFCCQGNEIPRLFDCRSMGSSINIKFSPCGHLDNPSKGFALCIVFKYEGHRNFDFLTHRMRFRCVHRYEIPQLTNHWIWENHVLMDMGSTFYESEHVFIQYFWDYDTHHNATEASFEFYLEIVDRDISVLDKYEVKKCGVCMANRQDAYVDEFIRTEHGLSDVEEQHDHVTGIIDIGSKRCRIRGKRGIFKIIRQWLLAMTCWTR